MDGELPTVQQLRVNRILPIWSHSHFLPMPVDDDGSCARQHILTYGRYHRYRDDFGRLVVRLCPERLSWIEKENVVLDDPMGSWEQKVAYRKVEKIAEEAALRRRRLEDEERGKR